MKKRNFVNLNVNPCKMCMPMGGAIAFKGMEQCMVLMHGSQGCSTYMRRHMATHYNEPVDIASSSLNEKETVYGGAKNLKKGLKNIIRQYQPKMIGVVTTCLAETIGEDILRIVSEFKAEENINDIDIVTVPTPGYGGSHFEGYYLALRKTLEQLVTESPIHGKVNIILGTITPADVREVRAIIDQFNIPYTLYPDFSDTLDAPYLPKYDRMSIGGTTVEDIKRMGGAVATIEMGMLVKDEFSPGKYLEEKFGVPVYRCPVPVGLEATDQFIEVLSRISRKPIPYSIQMERGRMLDGMIDSHKYNGEGKAVIFGDPETVYASCKICLENGIQPAIVATGTCTEQLEKLLREEWDEFSQKGIIIDDTDFDTIMSYVEKVKPNIAIGNSDGRCITERFGIPLVRIGFPIHDRVGAQRQLFVGYKGSMRFIDEITNTLLDRKHSRYRQDTYDRYYV